MDDRDAELMQVLNALAECRRELWVARHGAQVKAYRLTDGRLIAAEDVEPGMAFVHPSPEPPTNAENVAAEMLALYRGQYAGEDELPSD